MTENNIKDVQIQIRPFSRLILLKVRICQCFNQLLGLR
jgi:hypothetical protein